MKLNEFKTKKVKKLAEGWGDLLKKSSGAPRTRDDDEEKEKEKNSGITNYGMAAFNPNKQKAQSTYAMGSFIKDFVSRASNALQSAIEGGLVNPEPATAPPSDKNPPAEPAAAAAPAASGSAPASYGKGTAMSMKPMTVPGAGTNAAPAASKPAAAPTAAPAAPEPSMGELLRKRRQQGYAAESRFSKLNTILESIINLGEEGEAPAETAQSISDYVVSFVKDYIKDDIADLGPYEAKIKGLADQVERSYKQDGGSKAFQTLGNLLWAASHQPGAQKPPAGQQQGQQGQQQGQMGGMMQPMMGMYGMGSGQTGTTMDQIKSLISKLTPEEKKQLLAMLNKELSGSSKKKSRKNKSKKTVAEPQAQSYEIPSKTQTQMSGGDYGSDIGTVIRNQQRKGLTEKKRR